MRKPLTLLAATTALALAACSPPPPPPGGTVDKLTVIDRKVGDGDMARNGMTVQVLYTGWLYDQHAPNKHGAKFDSTADHGGEPFAFTLGAGQVIEGWDKGVVGMRVGGERTLLIPAALGYGARGAGNAIPPNASLVFDIQLKAVGR